MHLVRNGGYGTRRAHRIVATFVRLARERGLAAHETDAGLMDEAARFAGEREPGLGTAELRSLLDPVRFIASHDQPGGTAPVRQREMIAARRATLEAAQRNHAGRERSLQQAREALQQATDELMAS